jgi:hypothetical protein
MQLEFAFLCNVANFLQDGRLVIFGADIDGMECSGLPALASQLCLVAKFWVFPDEPTEGHTVSLELTRPDGERVQLCANQPLEAIRNRRDDARPSSAQVTLVLMINFEAAGTYQFHLSADGTEMKTVPFYVAVVPQAEERHNDANRNS